MKTNSLHLPPRPQLKDFQNYVALMIIQRGFQNESPKETFLLLTEEIGELARALRQTEKIGFAADTHQARNLGEEIADCFIYLLKSANKYHLDLETAFRQKEEKNKKRSWS